MKNSWQRQKDMHAKVYSGSVVGLAGALVNITIGITGDEEAFTVGGLSDVAAHEIRERLASAITLSDHLFPCQHICIDIVPSALCSNSQTYDIPIVIGLLLASGQIKPNMWTTESLFLGALASGGEVRHVPGILPMVIAAREKQFTTVFVPAEDAGEASLVDGIAIYPVETLAQLIAHVSGERQIVPLVSSPHTNILLSVPYVDDMALIPGQEHVKRALEVAVSGAHHLLLYGSQDAGRRALAQATPSIFPSMTDEEALVVAKISSIASLLSSALPLVMQRPFRALSPVSSQEELIGSGERCYPGEMSLAHEGVLFLEELPEYEAHMQEMLCQVIKKKEVAISYAGATLTYPAHFLLIASMQPCPCGRFMDPTQECTCSPSRIAAYQRRVSTHLHNLIDISIEVPCVDGESMARKRQVENSQTIRTRVQVAQERQIRRFVGTSLTRNAEIGPSDVHHFCQVEPLAEKLLQIAVQQLDLSVHASCQVLKLARTIADLGESDLIAANHIAEAIQYRPRIRR